MDITTENEDLEDDFPHDIKIQMQIWLWFIFFRENPVYKKYCDARRREDHTECRLLEEKHTKIAELFTDWGYIHDVELADTFNPDSLAEICRDNLEVLPYCSDDLYSFVGIPEWEDWFDQRRDLFITPEGTTYGVRPFVATHSGRLEG